MKLALINTETDRPCGHVNVPDEVMNAAALVRKWMADGGVIELANLKLCSGVPCYHLGGSKWALRCAIRFDQ